MNAFTRLLATVAAVFVAAGCTTPQPVLDLGNQGALLTNAYGQQLENFRRTESFAESYKLWSIGEKQQFLSNVKYTSTVNVIYAGATGSNPLEERAQKFRVLFDKSAQALDARSKTQAKDQTELAALLKPLPSAFNDIGAAAKAFGVMGAELSNQERFSEMQTIVTTIGQGLKSNTANNASALKDARKAADASD